MVKSARRRRGPVRSVFRRRRDQSDGSARCS
jgi:hypothetical protein